MSYQMSGFLCQNANSNFLLPDQRRLEIRSHGTRQTFFMDFYAGCNRRYSWDNFASSSFVRQSNADWNTNFTNRCNDGSSKFHKIKEYSCLSWIECKRWSNNTKTNCSNVLFLKPGAKRILFSRFLMRFSKIYVDEEYVNRIEKQLEYFYHYFNTLDIKFTFLFAGISYLEMLKYDEDKIVICYFMYCKYEAFQKRNKPCSG